MTPQHVANNLATLMHRGARGARTASINPGTRVTITWGGITASGTVIAGYNSGTTEGAIVELDGKGARINAPREIMGTI
jgi:hypothetical protein|tara:strand:+ start:220 stop:456 length:237 start_codon:yes stop_codon:yes gene_type:complete